MTQSIDAREYGVRIRIDRLVPPAEARGIAAAIVNTADAVERNIPTRRPRK